MDDPIYLLHLLVTVTMFVAGLFLIMDGISEDHDHETPDHRHQH